MVRSLLLAPRTHFINRDVLSWSETWLAIHRIQVYLTSLDPHARITRVIANFGKWETQASNDDSPYAIDCHAHVHLHLNRTAVDKLSDDLGCKGIRGRINAPKSQLEDDCCRLEARLIGQEHKQVMSELKHVKATVGNLQATVGNLETKFDHLETKFGNLETKFDHLETTVGNLQANLDTKFDRLETLMSTIIARLPAH